MLADPKSVVWEDVLSMGKSDESVEVSLYEDDLLLLNETWNKDGRVSDDDLMPENNERQRINKKFDLAYREIIVGEFRYSGLYRFDPEIISQPVTIKSDLKLEENGRNLAGVLDQLQNSSPEKFGELNRELNNWFPEYERIIFEVPEEGKKNFLLRTSSGKYNIKAADLSDGTRLALAYLTIAYLPDPPKIVAFEEPERGVHPRLLGNIQEAMYRLAYPENYGEDREPVQVIATTHSPYLLDLYKEHPEEIVISSKDENGVHFTRLIDQPHFEEVIKDAPLGDIWYSGVLGGVPIQP